MDTKAIVEKAVKGDESYKTDIKDFTPEQLVTFNKAWADAELAKVTALRAEGRRVDDKNKAEDATFSEKFRGEQLTKARNKFFNDPRFALSDKEKEQFETEFKKMDDGSYDAELIFNSMKRTFAIVKADDLIEGSVRAAENKKNAAQFNAQGAQGTGFISSADEEKYSKAAKDLFREWQQSGFKNKTLDQAQKLVDKGANWKSRSLAK